MKRLLSLVVILFSLISVLASTPIRGIVQVDSTAMTAFVQRHNPDFDPAIARAFQEVGERYGIRGDMALCQAIIETGWFRFDNGTAVKPSQHNSCGMGVTERGNVGCSFETIEEGVTALIQHLFAYCCDDELPDGEDVVDPRFKYVTRGCAPYWEDLTGRWAMNDKYAKSILRQYDSLCRHSMMTRPAIPEIFE